MGQIFIYPKNTSYYLKDGYSLIEHIYYMLNGKIIDTDYDGQTMRIFGKQTPNYISFVQETKGDEDDWDTTAVGSESLLLYPAYEGFYKSIPLMDNTYLTQQGKDIYNIRFDGDKAIAIEKPLFNMVVSDTSSSLSSYGNIDFNRLRRLLFEEDDPVSDPLNVGLSMRGNERTDVTIRRYILKENVPAGYEAIGESKILDVSNFGIFIFENSQEAKNFYTSLESPATGDDVIEGRDFIPLSYLKGLAKMTNKVKKTETPPDKKEILISKTDLDGKELPGAKVEIRSGSTAITSWTSDGTDHKVKLDAGTYTFHEETAPVGYDVVTDIKFKVDSNGNVTILENTTNGDTETVGNKLIVKDAKKQYPLLISKTDLGGTELSGAKIVILDSTNKEVTRWTSEPGKKQEVKLTSGSYTLKEEVAPNGYKVISSFNFKVDENGKVTVTSSVTDGDVEVNGNTVIIKDKKIDEPTKTPEPNRPGVPSTGISISGYMMLGFIGLAGLLGLQLIKKLQ